MLILKISALVAPKCLWRGAQASALTFLLFALAELCPAQSIDLSAPSPVRANEVVGTIAARDLGDSRLTDHFYAFTGRAGDLLITVESQNLNGDVDLFTAGSLRPLMKFTLYAESNSPVTRTLFLRKREDLILRVEARSPNDDEGIYRIRFGGSFEPVPGNDPVVEANDQTPEPSNVASRAGSRRVSSVGARIEEPPAAVEEIAAAPTPEPTPEEVAVPTPTPEPPTTAEPATRAPEPEPRRRRGRVPPVRRRPAPPPAKTDEQASAEATTEEKASGGSEPEAPVPASRRAGRRGSINRPTEQIPVREPPIGPRLVIQLLDGTNIERFMSTIRRVTVENNQIVVVRRDGVIERTRMSEVLRMAIEP